jgi:carbonic anhydrase
MHSFVIAALLATAEAAKWDYKTNNGDDWPQVKYDDDTVNKCGNTN